VGKKTRNAAGFCNTQKNLLESRENFSQSRRNSEWNGVQEFRETIMSDKDSATLTAEPVVKPKNKKDQRPKRQPRFHVILWDDDDHSYEYVILMMRQIFGHSIDRGFKIANAVDSDGRSVCLTTTREHAELKVEQIHSFGKDFLIPRCKGSMSATIEAEASD
jgi:ATP-dependent Clp protease adaptor protein ClpS